MDLGSSNCGHNVQGCEQIKLDRSGELGYSRIMRRMKMTSIRKKIDNNNLIHYFIRDHRELPASYLKSCEKFFKQIRKANHERSKKEK
jgi:hypothetical protein